MAAANLLTPNADNFFQHLSQGINQIVGAPTPNVYAYSSVQMDVVVVKERKVCYAVNMLSESDKIRPTQRVRGLGFSSDSRLLFMAAGDEVCAVDWAAGEVLWSYVPPRSFGFMIISPIALATAPGLIAVTFDNGSIGVWSEHGVLQSMWRHNDAPRQLAFSADGSQLIGTDSFSLTIWDWHASREVERRRLVDRAYGFAYSPKDHLIALRSLTSVEVFAGLERLHQFPVGTGLPLVAFHPAAAAVAASDQNGVTIHDLGGAPPQRVELADKVLSMAFLADGKRLLIGSRMMVESEYEDFACSTPVVLHACKPE